MRSLVHSALPAGAVPLLMMALPAGLQGQIAQQKLPLGDAVAQALSLNPELNIRKSQLEAKSLEWKTALGLYTPEIGYAKEGISSVGTQPFAEQRFTAGQEIDFPLTVVYRQKKIRLEKEAMRKDLEALQKEVVAGTKSRYLEVIHTDRIRELRKTTHSLAEQMLEAVNERFASGSATYSDRLSAEIGLLTAENKQYEAEKNFHLARYNLLTYIGMDPDRQVYDLVLDDSVITHQELIPEELALYRLQIQPEYQSAILKTQAATFGLKEARSSFLPAVRLAYLKQDFGTGYHFDGFETGLRIPIWGFFEQSGNAGMARAFLNEMSWQEKSVELDINFRIETAWHSYNTSLVTMERFTNQLKNKSQEFLDLTTADFRAGKIDRLKYLEAQQVYLANRETYLEALHNHHLQLIELEKYMDFELIH